MTSAPNFDAQRWRALCQTMHASCQRRAMSSLHFSLLLNQSMEDALRTLPLENALQAIRIAREYDYETAYEVTELVQWVSDNAHCRHGVQWSHCINACDHPCGADRKSKATAAAARPASMR